jgi:hypothetical protein
VRSPFLSPDQQMTADQEEDAAKQGYLYKLKKQDNMKN